MTTILVTGGSGFFGKSILESFARGALVELGVKKIVALSRNASALRVEAPALVSEAVELVDADVTSLRSLHGADLVIHAAASSDAGRYKGNAQAEQRVIVEGTRRVLELAARAHPPPRLVHVSSGAVYGRQPADLRRIPEGHPFSEDVEQEKTPYTLAKREAEAIVREKASTLSRGVAIARCFAFVGPWLPLDLHFAIGNFLRDALRGGPIIVRARHSVFRSYMFADDLVEWLVRPGLEGKTPCEIYNVGSDEEVEIRQLAQLVGRVAQVPVETPGDLPASMSSASVDRYVPDVTLAQRELDLKIKVRLAEAVTETMRRIKARAKASHETLS